MVENIDLGFPEQRPSGWLTNRYFPSKIGGKPAWLELEKLPTVEQLRCKTCRNTTTFLCQIYAPGQEKYNFHRTIFVFICRSQECQVGNKANNFIALRSQLGLQNKFYSDTPPPEDGEPLPEVTLDRKLCDACGSVGPFACGRCRKINYCSSHHQRLHWPLHKKYCSKATEVAHPNSTDSTLQAIIFPEYETIIESKETRTSIENADNDEDTEEGESLENYKKLVDAGKAGQLQNIQESEIEKYTHGLDKHEDEHFQLFKREIDEEPTQIIRYKQGGQPLWIADTNQTFNEGQLNVPACELCGEAREFEFQIMPQALLLLKDETLDWGVVAVYTCSKSCNPPSDVGYVREYIVKQDILGGKF